VQKRYRTCADGMEIFLHAVFTDHAVFTRAPCCLASAAVAIWVMTWV
jgi:hypothetical protein